MRNIWIITKRELKHYFISPIAYAVAFMILLILGIIFYFNVYSAALNQYAPDIQIVANPLVTLFLFTIPAVTMRTVAEEQKNGTLEVLLTAPVRDWELIVGKWLGSFIFILAILLVTWIYPLILNQLVSPGIDQGLLVSNYIGLILLAGSFLAVGVASSSFFSNQIAAFFTTVGIFLVLWMIGFPAQSVGEPASSIFRYLDMSAHFYDTFNVGIIELKDILYYFSITALALFLGTVSIETRRWR